MMQERPLVSVLCISMNHEKYIRQSFLSAVNQTYRNIELFYVDNNSADTSFEIADAIFTASGLPYKGYKRDKGYGVAENLNLLLEQAQGKYIATLSADDWWELNNLEEKIAYYEQHPEWGMLNCMGYLHFYDTGKTILEKIDGTAAGWVLPEILQMNFINTVGVIIKKEAIDAVGMFDIQSPLEDWDMWIRIAEKYSIGFFNIPLAYYGKNTGSNISDNKLFMAKGYDYIFKKYGHYKEIAEAKKRQALLAMYDTAAAAPSLAALLQLLRHFRLTGLHVKQTVKCMFGIAGLKK